MYKIIILFLVLFAMNAKAEIVNLHTIDEIKSKINNLPEETVIFIDIDDTLITPKSSSFRIKGDELNLIDEIKRDKHLYPNYKQIISNWRLAREVILVENAWPEFIIILKKKYKVFALTKMDTGEFGNIKSMEEWRYNELQKFGIEFSNISGISDNYYQGIFMTGSYLKSQIIEKYLTSFKPTHIIFIDDKEEYIEDVANFCSKTIIPFTAILYRGVDRLSGKFDPEIKRMQLQYLIKEAKWLEDEQIKPN